MGDGVVAIIHIVGIDVAGDQHVQGVMDIVVPLRGIVAWFAVPKTGEVARLIVLVFEDEMDMALSAERRLHARGEFSEDVGVGNVEYSVYRIESQAVEVILLQPIKRG